MKTSDGFHPATGGEAHWPGLPAHWSYSSLREAEECPRRWALTRASYPGVWDSPGYPPKPALSALVGEVVHLALEHVLLAFRAPATEGEVGVAALRELGGYSALVRRVIDERLDQFDANPRMAPRIESIRALLIQRVPEIRHRVQSLVARMRFQVVDPPPLALGGNERGSLKRGTYAEVELRAPDLRFVGRADVIQVTNEGAAITDYKSGEPDSRHGEQLRTYALLWRHDAELNPAGRIATTLVIAYPTHDEIQDAPDETDLEELRKGLGERIGEAERDLLLRPPPARPTAETCRYCAVKHLCEDYWSARPLDPSEPIQRDIGSFVDLEGTVAKRSGPRSFVLANPLLGNDILLRTPTETPPFRVGDYIRLVGVAHTQNDEAARRIATITQGTDVFVIDS